MLSVLGYGLQQAYAEGAPASVKALTYEGTIEQDGLAYNGTADVLVSLWSGASQTEPFPAFDTGASDCGTLEGCECGVLAEDATVLSGRFSVTLPEECADAVHDNPDLWLELRVRVNGAEENFGRTALRAAPYALEASHSKDSTHADVADHATYNIVPVGGIIPWWHPRAGRNANTETKVLPLPDNFMVCNGALVDDEESPLNGFYVPNLNDEYLKAGRQINVGEMGGDFDYSVSVANGGEHVHRWIEFRDEPGLTVNRWGSWTESGDWAGTRVAQAVGHDGDSRISTLSFWDDDSVNDTFLYTRKAGIHNHAATINSADNATGVIEPHYMRVEYLIRVK